MQKDLTQKRLSWFPVMERAKEIVESYETLVTLRQLFYRLISEELLPNTTHAYKHLSRLTSEGRRDDTFPALIDRGRTIHRFQTFGGPDEALDWLRDIYRRDRTEGQPTLIYLGVEKAGIVEQLRAWFGDTGLPIVAFSGYSSQSYADEIAEDVQNDGRPAVLIYAGDHDASGEDILRDFRVRCDVFDEVRRVALDADQVRRYSLPTMPGKATDSRAKKFAELHGSLIQVELDALPPETLRELYQEAIDEFYDASHFKTSVAREERERDTL